MSVRSSLVTWLAVSQLLLASVASAQGPRSAQLSSTACPGSGCLLLGVEGYGSAAVDLVFSGVGSAVVEASIDGINFRTLAASATNGSGTVTSMSATGAWFVNVAGMTQVRVRLTDATNPVVAQLQATRSGGGTSGGGGGGGDASAANQSTQITSLQLIDNLPLSQGSSTSGQQGILMQGAVTTSAPTYTTGQTSPLSIAPDGSLRVSGGGGGTQYTAGSAQATPTGTVALGWDGANVRAVSTNASGQMSVVFPTAQTVTGAGGTFPVTDSGGSLTVDNAGTFAVQAAQSGTWNVTNISGTISLPTGAATSANQSTEITSLQLIDDLRLAQASTTSGQAGVMIMGAVTTSAPTYTTGQTSPLSIAPDGSLRVSGSAGTTQYAEDSVAADGQQIVALGFVRRDTTPTSSAGAAGDYAWGNVDANGRIFTQAVLYNSTGTELTPSLDVTEDAAETAGGTGPMVLSVRRDTPASSAGASGDNATFNTDTNGYLWSRFADPCSALPKQYVRISQTANAQLFTGTASNRTYVCHFDAVTATAQNIALVNGTGTTCDTGTAGMAGGATAATGWNFAANTGIAIGDGNGTVTKSTADAANVCLFQSGSGQVSGVIAYVTAAN